VHEIPMNEVSPDIDSVAATIAGDSFDPADGLPWLWRAHGMQVSCKNLAPEPSAYDLGAKTAFRGGV
jgi:hypothetical protein